MGRSMLPITLKDPVVILINSCVDSSYIIIPVDCSVLPLLFQRFPGAIETFILKWDEIFIHVCFLCYQPSYHSYCLEICDHVDFATDLRTDNT